jgi:hypothetical protein
MRGVPALPNVQRRRPVSGPLDEGRLTARFCLGVSSRTTALGTVDPMARWLDRSALQTNEMLHARDIPALHGSGCLWRAPLSARRHDDEELDRKPDWPERLDVMRDAGWDRLYVTSGDRSGTRRTRITKLTSADPEARPAAGRKRVRSPKPRRHRRLCPFLCSTPRFDSVRKHRAIAQRTVTIRPYPIGSCGRREDPRALLERWPVTHMLVVPTLELGYPLAGVILTKSHDRTLHTGPVRPYHAARRAET